MFSSRNPNPQEDDFVDLSYDGWYQIFNSNLDILNLSFGPVSTPTNNFSTIENDIGAGGGLIGGYAKNRFDAYWNTSESKRPIIIQAAGNESQIHPSVAAFWGLNANNPFVIVVSVGHQGKIWDLCT